MLQVARVEWVEGVRGRQPGEGGGVGGKPSQGGGDGALSGGLYVSTRSAETMTVPWVVESAGGITLIWNDTASEGPGEGGGDPSWGSHDPSHLNTTVEQAGTYWGSDSRKVLNTTGTVVRLCTVN